MGGESDGGKITASGWTIPHCLPTNTKQKNMRRHARWHFKPSWQLYRSGLSLFLGFNLEFYLRFRFWFRFSLWRWFSLWLWFRFNLWLWFRFSLWLLFRLNLWFSFRFSLWFWLCFSLWFWLRFGGSYSRCVWGGGLEKRCVRTRDNLSPPRLCPTA